MRLALTAAVASAFMLAACGQDDPPASSAAPTPSGPSATAPGGAAPGAATPVTAAGDPAKGRQVWLGQCIACHNPDPAKDGAIGPAVKGSPPELVEAKVLRSAYPPGYTPKRQTNIMPPRPDLVAAVPDLAAYLR